MRIGIRQHVIPTFRVTVELLDGLSPADAVLAAAQQRLRPILLTTATTVGGLLPLWLGGGPMWEPMAVAIIFGLVFATVLTLGVVPLLYSLFFKVGYIDADGSNEIGRSGSTAWPDRGGGGGSAV